MTSKKVNSSSKMIKLEIADERKQKERLDLQLLQLQNVISSQKKEQESRIVDLHKEVARLKELKANLFMYLESVK